MQAVSSWFQDRVRRRRLMQMEARLEVAWKNTKANWALAKLRMPVSKLPRNGQRVLSVSGGAPAGETVQQTQLSCDIYED